MSPVKPSLRVAVVNLTSGGFSGGYVKYLRELVPRMRRDARVSELLVAGPHTTRDLVDWTWPATDERRRFATLRAHVSEWRPDVVLIPTARHAAFGDVPVVTMVRNMEPLVMPFSAPTLPERLRNVARYAAALQSSRRATRVIAVSDFVRDFLVERWAIPTSRVDTVPHGVDVVHPGLGRRPDAPDRMPEVFAAGSIRPARGIEDLLTALSVLRHRGMPTTLWFAGSPTPGAEAYFAHLRRTADELGVGGDVCWLGALDAQEMQWCFEASRLFVMTSRTEACPNTVLESMAMGARAVSTDARPMPEFFADTATYYKADDGVRLAEAIAEALHHETPVFRARLQASTRARASTFTWSRTADATLASLQRAVRLP